MLAERSSRFTKLVRVPYERTAERVAARLATEIEHLPEALRRSLSDRAACLLRGAPGRLRVPVPLMAALWKRHQAGTVRAGGGPPHLLRVLAQAVVWSSARAA
jgi:hypothetical protein